MHTNALFIAIEGLDGSGGTTQVRELAGGLTSRAMPVLCTEPTDGPIGRLIRRALSPSDEASVLSDAVLPYLFAADRRDHLDRRVLPALHAGTTVIIDRYVPSSLAYQGLTIGVDAAFELNAAFRAPDLTVVLEVSPEECMRRIAARGGTLERFEDLERLTAIRTCYAAGLHDWSNEATAFCGRCTRPVDDVAARIRAAVEELRPA